MSNESKSQTTNHINRNASEAYEGFYTCPTFSWRVPLSRWRSLIGNRENNFWRKIGRLVMINTVASYRTFIINDWFRLEKALEGWFIHCIMRFTCLRAYKIKQKTSTRLELKKWINKSNRMRTCVRLFKSSLFI